MFCFRENPGQLHRISPWLNRELSALMYNYENIYVAQEVILDLLQRKHILSNSFRRTISVYITAHLDHFIHEFYHYARSQFDMMGYDSHVRYNFRRPESLLSTYPSSESEDSDVRVIDSPNDCVYVAPRTPEVIVIHSDNSDSDVIYQAPTPPPVVVVDSDTDNQNEVNNENSNSSSKLPIKLRLKLKKTKKRKSNKNNNKRQDYCECSCYSDSESETPRAQYRIQGSSSVSTESSSSSSEDSQSDSDSSYTPQKVDKRKIKSETSSKRRHRKLNSKRLRKNKKRKYLSSDSDSSEKNYKVRKSSKKYKNKKSKRTSKKIKNYSDNSSSVNNEDNNDNFIPESTFNEIKQELPTSIPLESIENPQELFNYKINSNDNVNIDVAGPSSSYSMPSVIVKNNNNMWFKKPENDRESSNSD